VSQGEAEWLAYQGFKLNRAVEEGARRAAWTFIDGATAAFRGHGYCARTCPLPVGCEDSWFRGAAGSFLHQGDFDGTLHPTAAGQAKLAELAARKIGMDYAVPAAQRLAVTFLRVRVVDESPDPEAKVFPFPYPKRVWLDVPEFGGHYVPDDGSDIPLDRWVDLDERYRFAFKTYGRHVAVGAELRLPTWYIDDDALDSERGDARSEEQSDYRRKPGRTIIQRFYRPFSIYSRTDGWGANPPFSRPPGRVCTVRAHHDGGVLELQYRIDMLPDPGTHAPVK
jgi:hypothetical protein